MKFAWIKAHLGGVFEQVEVVVINLVTFGWVEVARVDIDPHRAVGGTEIVGQVRPRHEVEPGEFHRLFASTLGSVYNGWRVEDSGVRNYQKGVG